MPGSGKTTLGKKLASQLGFAFIDLDQHIEVGKQMSIGEIFASEGEQGFRFLEQAALKSTAQMQSSVIATGGGTPCFEDNMDWMNNHGKTIYLKANLTLLKERLLAGKSKRPMLNGLKAEELQDFLEQLLSVREPYYLKAQQVIQVPVKNAQTLVESVFPKD